MTKALIRPYLDCISAIRHLREGRLEAVVKFAGVDTASGFDLIAYYDAASGATLAGGIPANSYQFFAIREYDGKKWNPFAHTGDRLSSLEAGREYHLKLVINGSQATFYCDGVEVLRTTLPRQYVQSQVGMMCVGASDITIEKFQIHNQKPKVFVIMQFSDPYNEVYLEVIKTVCHDLGVEVLRIDESQGPGLIIADINRAIVESTLVIADVSPVNANVFYEVGYAHGLNKPTILIAQKETKLPFDVSPFRTLFYENTIGGKPKLEKGLREYVHAILKDKNLAPLSA